MDFQQLLNVANYNSNEAKYESSIKTYSTVLPPPKKPDKSSVQSENIKKFLAKRKAEEQAKIAEAQAQKEKLLQLRAQNSKNSKKAKLMAARTKDNDFSKIKLSEDEIITKKKIEIELQRQHLKDKKERMKTRIDMEEKEALLPRKRKRKSKQSEIGALEIAQEEAFVEEMKKEKVKNGIRKPLPPPPVSFHELLKIAEQEKNKPILIPKRKEEERLMTKKEKKLAEEEHARLRRKQERLERGIEPGVYSTPPIKNEKVKLVANNSHVEKNKTENQVNGSSKFKIPKSSVSVNSGVTEKKKSLNVYETKSQQSLKIQSSGAKEQNIGSSNNKIQMNSKENGIYLKKSSNAENVPFKKATPKIKPVATSSKPKQPVIDTEALTADIERRVRDKLERKMAEDLEKQLAAEIEKKLEAKLKKELEEKYIKSLEEQRKKLNLNDDSEEKLKKPMTSKSSSGADKLLPKKSMDKNIPIKKIPPIQKPVPKPPPKKPFHKNPYLDPPRRVLEPLIPPKRRQVIEDDDDEDEDDDMSDFIDDGPSVDDDNYSQHIKEIFGYDRNRYIDDDDDDIVETSFVEQMKEEIRSAKQGYLEDLEEERKQRKEEMERKKRKKMK